MGWSKYQALIAAVLVVTGSINTLSTKWADRMDAEDSDGKLRKFNHPFVQACSMFIGEMLCLLVFKFLYFYYSRKHDGSQDEMKLLKGNRSFNPLVLLPPAMCDMVATSVMYIGLTLTYASSFQMLRGAVIVFVGVFSVLFLNRKLVVQEWGGIFLVIGGLALVGVSDFFTPSESVELTNVPAPASNHSTGQVVLGDMLIIGAQVVAASQMVLEEKFVSGLDIPALQAVGWEGLFGFSILGFMLIPFYFIQVPEPFSDNPRHVLEDVLEAFIQMRHNPLIICAVTGTILSIAFFNFAGITVTKEISATTRMVLDSVRTLFIFSVSLALGWQTFYWLQIIGFILLVIGMGLYNNVFAALGQKFALWRNRNAGHSDTDTLISQPADESDPIVGSESGPNP
ncbi:Solute carrier family 35 member F6 [Cryptotermes secundus]|uniref:Solute carrier family 35 member F6 n=1 Tax=Cryptotermes secundus TaxID=105785 RepID=A0A2J7RA08_9NEOP|nr:solute carrier family 35 member F6 [Cryptotermes secundus]PNF37656.1 Solute carrier family 35 member F6 [Cryptotermes secundus]